MSNRKSNKGNRGEDRRGATEKENLKTTQNPRNLTENVSTAGNEAHPQQNRTDLRNDERDSGLPERDLEE